MLEVPIGQVFSYSVIDAGAENDALTEVHGLVEKPALADAPSNKTVMGAYMLQSEVMRVLENQGTSAGGEIQLTHAIAKMINTQPFHAVTLNGARYDCGSKVGFVEATLAVARGRHGPDVQAMIHRMTEPHI